MAQELQLNGFTLNLNFDIKLITVAAGVFANWIFNEMYLFTAKAQNTQRFNYFLFSGERPESKENQLYKINLITKRDYICNTSIIFRKSALLVIAVLPVRRYLWRINGKE